ncbi:MAG: hypothetical protein KJ023_21005 [Burkholderiaceae bacterium]|nr:hypothetical protein [Burkholderiaceae bacterium]
MADLGQVFAHLASRAAAARTLAERAISDGDVVLVDALTDCIAAIGCVADLAAKSCGQSYLMGGIDGWHAGASSLAREALERLTLQASARDVCGRLA